MKCPEIRLTEGMAGTERIFIRRPNNVLLTCFWVKNGLKMIRIESGGRGVELRVTKSCEDTGHGIEQNFVDTDQEEGHFNTRFLGIAFNKECLSAEKINLLPSLKLFRFIQNAC